MTDGAIKYKDAVYCPVGWEERYIVLNTAR